MVNTVKLSTANVLSDKVNFQLRDHGTTARVSDWVFCCFLGALMHEVTVVERNTLRNLAERLSDCECPCQTFSGIGVLKHHALHVFKQASESVQLLSRA